MHTIQSVYLDGLLIECAVWSCEERASEEREKKTATRIKCISHYTNDFVGSSHLYLDVLRFVLFFDNSLAIARDLEQKPSSWYNSCLASIFLILHTLVFICTETVMSYLSNGLHHQHCDCVFVFSIQLYINGLFTSFAYVQCANLSMCILYFSQSTAALSRCVFFSRLHFIYILLCPTLISTRLIIKNETLLEFDVKKLSNKCSTIISIECHSFDVVPLS